MIKYTPWSTDWRYTKFNIDNLDQIQQEFVKVKELQWHKFCDHDLSAVDVNWWDFSVMPRSEIESMVPTLVAWFDKKGILDKWTASAFSVIHKEKYPMRIHVDSTLTDERRVSLNMPFQNCENTWTCWYDANIDMDNLPLENPDRKHSRQLYDPALASGLWFLEDNAQEIDRAEMDSPVIVNVTIPHRPVSGHDNQRILLCHRFTPELTEEEINRICNL